MANVKEETISGAKWNLLQKFTLQPLQFVYGVILARLISPEEFGILGLTAIFFALAAVLQDCGFGSALIREIHRTDEDINTVFWTNLGISFLLCTVLWFCAPLFVVFFHQPPLLWLTRVSAVMMFLQATGSVHWTLYSCRRDFKIPSIIRTVATVVAMPCTIAAAFAGWSYWALMMQGVVSGLLSLIAVWYLSPWKPRFVWSFDSFRKFFLYGSKLMMSGVLDSIYSNLRTLLVGKVYSPADLGLITRASNLSYLPSNTLNSALGTVTFPILAAIQEDESRLLSVYSLYIRITSMVLFFSTMLIAALAHPFIFFVYGPGWSDCAVYVQILAFAVMWYHFGTINTNLLLVKGRSDYVLRITIIKRILATLVVIAVIPFNMIVVCFGSVALVPISFVLNGIYTARICHFPFMKQMRDFLPYFLMSLVSCAPAYLVTYLPLHPVWQLLLGVAFACTVYALILRALHDVAYARLLTVIAERPLIRKLQSHLPFIS